MPAAMIHGFLLQVVSKKMTTRKVSKMISMRLSTYKLHAVWVRKSCGNKQMEVWLSLERSQVSRHSLEQHHSLEHRHSQASNHSLASNHSQELRHSQASKVSLEHKRSVENRLLDKSQHSPWTRPNSSLVLCLQITSIAKILSQEQLRRCQSLTQCQQLRLLRLTVLDQLLSAVIPCQPNS